MTNNEKINMIFVLADIIEQYATEALPEYTMSLKNKCKRIKEDAGSLVKLVDTTLSKEDIEAFGVVADEIRKALELGYINNQQNC